MTADKLGLTMAAVGGQIIAAMCDGRRGFNYVMNPMEPAMLDRTIARARRGYETAWE